MQIKKIVYENVLPNGTFKDDLEHVKGSVETKGLLRMSTGEGCGLTGCHCSDGYWMTIGLPITIEGKVEVIRVIFSDKTEMDAFFKFHQMTNVSAPTVY